ncbi:MAG: sensor histidine kinase N-terminal domain-containing protein, partial [Candidatus Thermoplasmatota archaeon]|nr:sensor histidine kinase N-terminal domain-containing protein [Candidatus Thermoplasmatota archaeon]
MSLRLRLLLMIGVSLSLLWGGVAVWMLRDLDDEMRRTLDQRLAMSARMVAGLISQNPAAWDARGGTAGVSTLTVPATAKGLACQVSSLRGEVFARTPGATSAAIATTTPGFAEREIDGERWRSYTVEAHGLRITTADRLAERNTLLRDVMVAAIVPFVVALIGSLTMLWLGVRSGLVPLERLRQALARRAPDALTPIPDAPMPRELQPLV